MRQQIIHQILIALVAAVVFFTNLGAAGLWDMDEALYSACAREMLARGDWVVPVFNGEMFPDKPPLMFWLMMAGMALFGETEFAVRFFSAVFGIATALLTYHIGRLLFRPAVGFWAGLIMASNIIFTISARAATVDAALGFATALAMFFLVVGALKAQAAAEGDATAGGDRTAVPFWPASWIWFTLCYAAVGLAVLAKGPIGVILPVVVMGLFLLISTGPALSAPVASPRRWLAWAIWALRLFSPANIGRIVWCMRPVTAVAVVGAVALPWYILVTLRTGGAWIVDFLTNYNLGPFVEPILGHTGPVWYHLVSVAVGFFPWSIFIWPAILVACRRLRYDDPQRLPVLFAVAWFGGFMIFWSVCAMKLPHYILPAYPALAMLTGLFIDEWMAEPARFSRVWMRYAAGVFFFAGAGLLVVMPVVASIFVPGEWMLGLVGLLLLAGGLAGLVFSERLQPRATLFVYVVTSAAFVTAVFAFAALGVDRHQDGRKLFAAFHARGANVGDLVTYRFFRESYVYYAGQPVSHCGSFAELSAKAAAEGPLKVLTLNKYEGEIHEAFPGQFEILAREPRFLHPDETVVILARRPAEAVQTAERPRNTLRP